MDGQWVKHGDQWMFASKVRQDQFKALSSMNHNYESLEEREWTYQRWLYMATRDTEYTEMVNGG